MPRRMISSISTFTTGLESRYNALSHDQLQRLGGCPALREFLSRAVDFLRCELTGNNATLIAAYLMGDDALPEGLDPSRSRLGMELLQPILYDLLKTQRYGIFGAREHPQKTFEKLDWLNNRVQELSRCVRQPHRYEECEALDIGLERDQHGTLYVPANVVFRFFRIIYSSASNHDVHAFAKRWTEFNELPLYYFMGFLRSLWYVGLAGREHECLMQILDAMLDDDSFREQCFIQAERGRGEDCNSDLLSFLAMQIALLKRQARNGELSDLEIYRLGRSDFWTMKIIRIVEAHAHEDFFNEWNVSKAGMVVNVLFHLHDELGLCGVPIEPYGELRPDMAQEALTVVRAELRDIARRGRKDGLREALVRWGSWCQLIERRHIGQFMDLDAQYGQLVKEHQEQAQNSLLQEGVLVEQCKKLVVLRDKERAERISELTEEEVRQFEMADMP